ncbi:MAG: radical SAM protein [Chloroflexia bacterium]
MALCDPIPTPTGAFESPGDVPPLTSFYLYLTSGCNLRCRHCWVAPSFSPGELDPDEYLDVDLLRRAVAEGKALGLRYAKLTGGEPLLHPRFVEIVDFLSAEGLELAMETNGTLLEAGLARYLRDHTRLTWISLSLDGATAEVHDAFRGVEGAFEAALRGLEALVSAGYRPQVIVSPHRGNVHQVEAVVDLAVRMGAGSVKFNPVSRSGRGIAMHERGEALDVVEVLEVAHFIRGPLQRRTPIPLILGTPPALYTVGELFHRSDGICQIHHILGILADGELALCGIGRTVPELCFGHLEEVSVAEVWREHPVLRELRRDLSGPFPDLCGRCLHARHCLTYCPAQNFLDGGRLISPSSLCLEAHRRGLFPAGRLREER